MTFLTVWFYHTPQMIQPQATKKGSSFAFFPLHPKPQVPLTLQRSRLGS